VESGWWGVDWMDRMASKQYKSRSKAI